MKKLLIIPVLLVSLTGCFEEKLSYETREPIHKYKLSVSGTDITVYEYTPKLSPNSFCSIYFSQENNGSGIFCGQKFAE